jgi:hypothetical protein
LHRHQISSCFGFNTQKEKEPGNWLDDRDNMVDYRQVKIFSSSAQRPAQLWGLFSLLSKGSMGCFPGGKIAAAWIYPLTSI